jgi:hypothetical protein
VCVCVCVCVYVLEYTGRPGATNRPDRRLIATNRLIAQWDRSGDLKTMHMIGVVNWQ